MPARPIVRLAALAFALVAVLTCLGQTTHHQRLATGLGNVNAGLLSENGYAAYLALTEGTAFDPWVAGRPFATGLMQGERTSKLYAFDPNGVLLWSLRSDVLDAYRHVFYGLTDLSATVGSATDGDGAGFDPAGAPVWFDDTVLYRGTTDFSTAILGAGSTHISGALMDRNGSVVWTGSGPATDGQRDVYYETTNISAAVIGPGARTVTLGAVRNGRVLWHGTSDVTGGNQDVFRDDTNLSAGPLGPGARTSYGVDLSPLALWTGMGDTTGGILDLFTGDTNLSISVLGNGGDRSSVGYAMSSVGVPLWQGQSLAVTAGNADLFVGTQNYSQPILGSARTAYALGFTTGSVPVWAGRGGATSVKFNVFLGTKNLTQDAYGASRACVLLAMNGRGQVLWRAQEPDFSTTVWLSSPAAATTVSGTIVLPGVQNPAPRNVTMRFLEPGTGDVLFEVTPLVETDGSYSVGAPKTGLFDVRVVSPHFLSRVLPGVPVYVTADVSVTLPNGDANLDNSVDVRDLNVILLRFGTAGGGDPVDLNEDGSVDLEDLLQVLLNFQLTGE